MKRKADKMEDFFLEPDNAARYLREAKKSSRSRFVSFLNQLKKLDVKGKYLEVGCGPGILTQIVARQHPEAEIIATDVSPEMLRLAKQDLDEDLKERVSYGIADACDMDSLREYGTFDLIYTTFTLHHWSNAEAGFRNLYQLLESNRILYVQDLKRVWWLYYFGSNNGFFKSIRASYRPKEIDRILQKIGIDDYKIKTIFPWFMQTVKVKKTRDLDR